MDGGELELIAWLNGKLAPAAGPGDIGFGDDMASLPHGARPFLIASDMILENTHFDLRTDALAAVGYKALAACLSDCAAMAVQPVAAVVSLALPRGRVAELGRPLLSAMLDCAARFHCPIVGGDTTSWDGLLAVDVAVVARPWPGVHPVRRCGARPGDILAVSGRLGGSRRGRHLSFTPRIDEARRLATALGPDLHALMDITDGLALDLHRMCAASGCGAVLDEPALAAAASTAALAAAAEDGRSAVDHVLHDGEDFELLMALAPQARPQLAACSVEHLVVGRCTADGLHVAGPGGLQPLAARGYVH